MIKALIPNLIACHSQQKSRFSQPAVLAYFSLQSSHVDFIRWKWWGAGGEERNKMFLFPLLLIYFARWKQNGGHSAKIPYWILGFSWITGSDSIMCHWFLLYLWSKILSVLVWPSLRLNYCEYGHGIKQSYLSILNSKPRASKACSLCPVFSVTYLHLRVKNMQFCFQ